VIILVVAMVVIGDVLGIAPDCLKSKHIGGLMSGALGTTTGGPMLGTVSRIGVVIWVH